MASDNRQSDHDSRPEVGQLFIESKKTDDAENRCEELKYRKARAQTAFTKTRNQLLNVLDDEECLNRRKIREIRRKLSEKHEEAVAIIDALAEEYSGRTDKVALRKTTEELEKLGAEYRETQNRVQTYLDNTLDDSSSHHSQKSSRHFGQDQVHFNIDSEVNYVPEDQLISEQRKTFQTNRFEEQYQSTPYSKLTTTTQSEPKSIGTDLWRELKRVSISVLLAIKTYENWKATFTACIDQAPATPEFQLR